MHQSEIEPQELREALQDERPPLLLDVREPWEYELARIDGARLLPLGNLASGLDTVPRNRPVVTICHHGVRSLAALEALRRAGVKNVRSLRGGMDAWSRDVDPTVPRY